MDILVASLTFRDGLPVWDSAIRHVSDFDVHSFVFSAYPGRELHVETSPGDFHTLHVKGSDDCLQGPVFGEVTQMRDGGLSLGYVEYEDRDDTVELLMFIDTLDMHRVYCGGTFDAPSPSERIALPFVDAPVSSVSARYGFVLLEPEMSFVVTTTGGDLFEIGMTPVEFHQGVRFAERFIRKIG